jgi:hypothetical protein
LAKKWSYDVHQTCGVSESTLTASNLSNSDGRSSISLSPIQVPKKAQHDDGEREASSKSQAKGRKTHRPNQGKTVKSEGEVWQQHNNQQNHTANSVALGQGLVEASLQRMKPSKFNPGPANKFNTRTGPENEDASLSPDSSDSDGALDSIDMQKLSQRGRGVYFCPRLYNCKRGGVDKDGQLIEFARNSAFMYGSQHLSPLGVIWNFSVALFIVSPDLSRGSGHY